MLNYAKLFIKYNPTIVVSIITKNIKEKVIELLSLIKFSLTPMHSGNLRGKLVFKVFYATLSCTVLLLANLTY